MSAIVVDVWGGLAVALVGFGEDVAVLVSLHCFFREVEEYGAGDGVGVCLFGGGESAVGEDRIEFFRSHAGSSSSGIGVLGGDGVGVVEAAEEFEAFSDNEVLDDDWGSVGVEECVGFFSEDGVGCFEGCVVEGCCSHCLVSLWSGGIGGGDVLALGCAVSIEVGAELLGGVGGGDAVEDCEEVYSA